MVTVVGGDGRRRRSVLEDRVAGRRIHAEELEGVERADRLAHLPPG